MLFPFLEINTGDLESHADFALLLLLNRELECESFLVRSEMLFRFIIVECLAGSLQRSAEIEFRNRPDLNTGSTILNVDDVEQLLHLRHALLELIFIDLTRTFQLVEVIADPTSFAEVLLAQLTIFAIRSQSFVNEVLTDVMSRAGVRELIAFTHFVWDQVNVPRFVAVELEPFHPVGQVQRRVFEKASGLFGKLFCGHYNIVIVVPHAVFLYCVFAIRWTVISETPYFFAILV